jgi:hypothetical protein
MSAVTADERAGPPWKWDVTVYDRPGWIGRFRGRARLATSGGAPPGEGLFLRFEELERASYFGDYFMGRHRDTWLASPDGGRSWRRAGSRASALGGGRGVEPAGRAEADETPNVDGVALADGSRLTVTHTVARLRGAALRDYLDRAGLARLWQAESFAWWDLRSPAHEAELTRRGVAYAAVRQPSAFLAYLNDLSVGRCAPGSREWTWSPVEGLPPMARLAGWWRQTGVLLEDGTVVGCAHGRVAPDEPHDSSFALRSTDGGRSWELSRIATATASVGFSEAFLTRLRDGRILALVRANAGDANLHRSVSADGGRTWSDLERTPVEGYPAHVIRLRSGALLCVYARRWHPQGVRAVLSYDEGQTWDVEREKVLRDDAVGSVGYPMSVQLADGTIFTAYELGKPVRAAPAEEAGRAQLPGPEEVRPQATALSPRVPSQASTMTRGGASIDMEARPQAYIAGSRYTESYVAPLGR